MRSMTDDRTSHDALTPASDARHYNPAKTAPQPDRIPHNFQPVARPWHTAILIVAQALLALRSATHAEQIRSGVALDRIHLYERTMLVQWLGFAFIVFGVWLAGGPLSSVIGERWRSFRRVLRDIAIGVGFSIVSTMLFSMLSQIAGHGSDSAVRALLPHGREEMALWVVLSITAGICEETLYRGYLQRQFMALTKSAPAGILLAALAFGVAHAYQGWHQAVVITLDGATLGALAYWRRSVRPGMVAHAWKDLLAPILMASMRH